ncbi:MAG: ankyrin repeat domain-containing protein [Vicinamibacterales bacterium]
MHVTIALAFLLALAQAPAPTKAEQFQDAARKGDAATVKKLLDEGVDVNTRFRYDATALFYACDHGHLEVVKLLLDRGADMSVKDTFYGFTPLALATSPAQKKTAVHGEIAKLLIQKGAPGKEEVLSDASQSGDTALVKVILDSGSLAAAVLSDALEMARAAKKTETAALLEQSGAKPYEDFKIEPAMLAKLAGAYKNASGNELTIAPAGARLTLGRADIPPEERLILVATGAQTFKAIGNPLTIAFQIEGDRIAGFSATQGKNPSLVYTRVEGK